MAEEEGGVEVARAERLRIERQLDSGRLAKMKTFKTRISDWATASPKVYDEPIIVTLKSKRTLKVNGERPYEVERVFDHFHADVLRFEELVSRKKAAGYVVSAKDAVLAYMLVFKRASRHLVAGFLSTFPEWRNITPETVGQAFSRLKAEGWLTSKTPQEIAEMKGPAYETPLTKYPPRFPPTEEELYRPRGE